LRTTVALFATTTISLCSAAGATFNNVVKATVLLSDIKDFAAVNEIYAKYLAPAGVVPPARTTVEVSRLPKDALVEIDLIACAPASNC